MSYSFFVSQDEKVEERYECQCSWFDGTPKKDCLDCHGTGEVVFQSDAHEFSFAHGTLAGIFEMLGLVVDHCGTIPVSQLSDIQRKITYWLNRDSRRESYTYAPFQEGIIYHGGMTDERMVRRLESFQSLVQYAIKTNQEIHWG